MATDAEHLESLRDLYGRLGAAERTITTLEREKKELVARAKAAEQRVQDLTHSRPRK